MSKRSRISRALGHRPVLPSGPVYANNEEWVEIEGFPRYMISSEGRVFNQVTNRHMRPSQNNYGHPKISLLSESGARHTRGLSFLVARAFLEPPNPMCDRVIWLNGEFSDCRAVNLAWRPRWFGWKYTHQLKTEQPAYYRNLGVVNLSTDAAYSSIIEAGMAEGLLFEHIWHSTYSGSPVFPYGSIWVVEDRV